MALCAVANRPFYIKKITGNYPVYIALLRFYNIYTIIDMSWKIPPHPGIKGG